MITRQLVLDLLERWQEARDQGRDLPATELCRDHPELLPELDRHLSDLRRLDRLAADLAPGDLQTAEPAAPGVTTMPDPHPPDPRPGTVALFSGATVAGYE